MSIDPLFPFPEPDFLFVHEVDVHQQTGVVRDERGKVSQTYARKTVRGYLTAPDPEVAVTGGAARERASAVLLVPRSEVVNTVDLVEATDPGIPENRRGRYTVSEVRPTAAHTRVLLTKYTGEWSV